MTACGSWSGSHYSDISGTNEYRTIAGVRYDLHNPSPKRTTVENALRRANIHYIYGDHAARYTQLSCREADVEKALNVIREIPPNERTDLILFDAI